MVTANYNVLSVVVGVNFNLQFSPARWKNAL